MTLRVGRRVNLPHTLAHRVTNTTFCAAMFPKGPRFEPMKGAFCCAMHRLILMPSQYQMSLVPTRTIFHKVSSVSLDLPCKLKHIFYQNQFWTTISEVHS